MSRLPTGTVTFLFTDIEGSTRLLQQLGDAYADVLADCRRLVRAAVEERGGQEFGAEGDALFAAFPSARDGLMAAITAQQNILRHPWPDGPAVRMRMGLHTGEARIAEGSYEGMDVNRAARICAAGHGGQVLVSDTVSALVTKDLPDGVSLRDLGEHRLKDLAHPYRLFQALAPDLPTGFPPLRSLDARPNNLPIQLTSFIGREKEIAEVKELLGAARLITLTGSGGAGKTRLALQVAADVLDGYPDGVWLAEFAPIADQALVLKTVASALNVPEQPGRDMMETLVDALRSKSLLLVLDNCEHLLSACADFTATLLRACPQVRILATSREGLGVPGETLWRVPSLSLPDVRHLPPTEELVLYDAVRLFVDRATATAPGFAVTSDNAPAVTQVCQRLDGIPLAIELAAARVKVLAVEQIAARLDDRFRLLTGSSRTAMPRQQTLRAAMDWSYNLLSEPEQVLLRRLSVFAGGWTLEAAEAVCSGAGVEPVDTVDLLTQLVDKSLIIAETEGDEARYRMLETVRQYGLSRLQESGEADGVRRRHRTWYLALAENAYPAWWRQQSELWRERLEHEYGNLRAALEWSSVEKDGAEAGLRLAGALWWFWARQGHWSEARKWLEKALARSDTAPRSALSRALAGASNLAWRQGDLDLATRLATKGLDISRELGDEEESATLLYQLANVCHRRGDLERARALFDECLTVSRKLGNKWMTTYALAGLGDVAFALRDHEQAMALHSESLATAREVGDKFGIACALLDIGNTARELNDYGRAAACFRESLTLCREMDDRFLAGDCFDHVALLASGRGYHERAARLFGAAEALLETLGFRLPPAGQADHDRGVASTHAALGDTAFATTWAEGRAMTLEQAVEYALAGEQPRTQSDTTG